MKGYKESLEECFSRARARSFACDQQCSLSSRDGWPREKLHEFFNGCIKAYNNSGCIKVSKHHDCHRWCEGEYSNLITRSLCKVGCNREYASFGDTKNTSEDIENNLYNLADSVSVM